MKQQEHADFSVKISFLIHGMKKKKSRTTLSDFPTCGVFLAKQLLLYCKEHRTQILPENIIYRMIIRSII